MLFSLDNFDEMKKLKFIFPNGPTSVIGLLFVTSKGESNFTQLLVEEAVEFVGRGGGNAPYFLYWAPDSTHAPSYSSDMLRGKILLDLEVSVQQ